MKVNDAYNYLARYLNSYESKIIICKIKHGQCTHLNDFLKLKNSSLTDNQVVLLEQLLTKRRKDKVPLAYLLGEHNFYGYDLKIDERCLIPRPETEELVTIGLDKIQALTHPQCIDLGTGSGAIALAIAMEIQDAQVIACDLSLEALMLAQFNLKATQVQLCQSHWLQGFQAHTFDLMLANPPYISYTELHHMNNETSYEPSMALFSKNNGLYDLHQIISNSIQYLKPKGWLGVEHGFMQSKAVQLLFKNAGYQNIEALNDMSGHPRMCFGQL